MSAADALPVVVIGGYLGAGKTTLINHLLRHAEGQRLSVLVNDFGAIAIDAALIAARDGDSMTLANGCVCCSIGGDFYRALTRVLDRQPRADVLVIEASGVAEPARIADIARAEPDLRLAGICVLADASAWPARRADPMVGGLVQRQVAAATAIVLNKCDLVSAEARAGVEAELRTLAPYAPIRRARHAAVSLTDILTTDMGSSLDAVPSAQSHEDDFARWSLQGDFTVPRADLEAFLRDVPPAVHRLKGFVTLAGATRPHLVQFENGRARIEDAPADLPVGPRCQLVALGPRAVFDPKALDRLTAAWRG
jgi:G3E family GTPase